MPAPERDKQAYKQTYRLLRKQTVWLCSVHHYVGFSLAIKPHFSLFWEGENVETLTGWIKFAQSKS